MKKFVLILILAVIAAPAFAGSSRYADDVGRLGHAPGDDNNAQHDRNGDDDPVNPVPEPGTMALASMGLIALGAAARKRRGK